MSLQQVPCVLKESVREVLNKSVKGIDGTTFAIERTTSRSVSHKYEQKLFVQSGSCLASPSDPTPDPNPSRFYPEQGSRCLLNVQVFCCCTDVWGELW